jgi:hypothetical protein
VRFRVLRVQAVFRPTNASQPSLARPSPAAVENVPNRRRVPAPATVCGRDVIRVQPSRNRRETAARAPLSLDPPDNRLWDRGRSANPDALRLRDRERLFRALADDPPLPLSDRRDDVRDELALGRRKVEPEIEGRRR